MKTLSIFGFMLLPIFGAAVGTVKGFILFIIALILLYCIYKYASKKRHKWQEDDSESFWHK